MKQSDKERLAEIITEIKHVISSMNLEISRPELSPGYDFEKATSDLTHEAEHNLRILHAKAKLGDAEALGSIRDLGVTAARLLEELTCTADSQRETVNRYPPLYRVPAILLTCDNPMTPVITIINREADFIRSLNLEQISDAFGAMLDYDFGLHFMCQALQLYAPDSQLEQSGLADFSMTPLERVQNRTPEEKLAASRINTFCQMVAGMVRTVYLRGSRTEVSNAAKSLAAMSLNWPLVGHAWQETWATLPIRMQELDLGKHLPFKVTKESGPGRPRNFDESSSTLFVLSLCFHLSEEKMIFLPLTHDELLQLDEIDKWLDGLRKTNPQSPEGREIAIGGEPLRLDLMSQWRLKSILLPKFPSTKCASKNIDLKQWKNAAFLLAESICEDCWENYPMWPSIVYQRAGFDKKVKRIRTKREAVTELIAKGLQNLVKSTA